MGGRWLLKCLPPGRTASSGRPTCRSRCPSPCRRLESVLPDDRGQGVIIKIWQPMATGTGPKPGRHLALRSLFTASGSLSRPQAQRRARKPSSLPNASLVPLSATMPSHPVFCVPHIPAAIRLPRPWPATGPSVAAPTITGARSNSLSTPPPIRPIRPIHPTVAPSFQEVRDRIRRFFK